MSVVREKAQFWSVKPLRLLTIDRRETRSHHLIHLQSRFSFSRFRLALKQHAALRGHCNSFFLEVVSRFSLSEGQTPTEGLVELLFSLLVFANGQRANMNDGSQTADVSGGNSTLFLLSCDAGDVYRTRDLTPFPECVDNSPVVRSVLPKLLLQYR